MIVAPEFYQNKTITVSSDIVGILGDPLHALEFWKKVFPANTPLALELLRWAHLSPDKVRNLAPHIAGFHGRTGLDNASKALIDPLDFAKLITVNALLEDTKSLTNEAEKVVENRRKEQSTTNAFIYVLIHQMEAEYILKSERVATSNVVLAVENHIGKKAASAAIDTAAKLRSYGHAVTDVFDVVHSLRSRISRVATSKWKIMLKELERARQCLVHLPIGVNKEDSLDFQSIDSNMLQDLSDIINGNKSRVIIEHQTSGLPQVRLNPNNESDLLNRAKKVVGMLQEHGILKI